MGILSKSCSLSQYTTSTDLPPNFLSKVADKIKYRAFIEIEQDSIKERSVKERSVGWVDLYNMLDSSFETVNFLKEPYITLSMRVDKRSIPASIIKRNCLVKEQEIMEIEGITFISGKRKKDIKESAKQSLLSKVLPTTQVYDMVWNYITGHVLFTNTSTKLCDEFQELFFNTFDLRLNIIELSIVGSVILSANKKSEEVVENFKYLEMPGSDFLTWLWYKYRKDKNEFKIGKNKVRLLFDNRVVLSDEDTESPQIVTCVGDSQSMNEIQTALDDNKIIIQAKLILTAMSGDYFYFVDSFYFDFKSIKTPKIQKSKNDDPDAMFYEKIYLIEEAIDILNKIYGEFVLDYSKKTEKENDKK